MKIHANPICFYDEETNCEYILLKAPIVDGVADVYQVEVASPADLERSPTTKK